MIRPSSRSVLLRFPHGLGDCAQLVPVLAQLRATWPNTSIDVACGPGRPSLFKGYARTSYQLDEPVRTAYDQVIHLDWHEAYRCYEGLPGTKATRCLMEVFGLWPALPSVPALYGEEAADNAAKYLDTLPRLAESRQLPDFVAIHYQGNTSKEKKDLPHDVIERFCEQLHRNGFVPVVLDWDNRCPFVDQKRVFRPDLTNDAEQLAALLDKAALVVAIDSGPGHVAQLTSTPVVMVWTKHHPYHFADRVGDVTHLVPQGHEHNLRGENRQIGLEFFEKAYKHVVYHDLSETLARVAADKLNIDTGAFRMVLKATSYAEDYYLEHKRSGLDYRGHGDWQVQYGQWLKESLDLPNGASTLDVGGAAGSIAAGLAKAGLGVHMIDLNNTTVEFARKDFGDVLKSANVCDAANLHLFGDRSFDLVHSAQTFEHFRPELVPFILAELYRVLKPGGLLFTSHDTFELYDRQGRKPEHEDPTHVCVWPRMMWDHLFREAGFVDKSQHWRLRLEGHNLSFLKRYDWDWWVLERPGTAEVSDDPQNRA